MTEPAAGSRARTELSLTDHLVTARLAGPVATPVASCLDNCRRLVAGDPDHTFGLSDWRHADFDDAVAGLAACGVTLDSDGNGDSGRPPIVDPRVAVEAIARQREVIRRVAADRGRVLLATGHAFALLPHYQALAQALAASGCTVLHPLDDQEGVLASVGLHGSIRYFGGVASLVVHGALQHTHRAEYMAAMVAGAGGPGAVDLVIADHGFAGAAVEAGIETLSIADVNDPALPLAQARGRKVRVLVVDDGLKPAVYEPVTRVLVAGASGRR